MCFSSLLFTSSFPYSGESVFLVFSIHVTLVAVPFQEAFSLIPSHYPTHFCVRQFPCFRVYCRKSCRHSLCGWSFHCLEKQPLFFVYDGSSKFSGDSLLLKAINQKTRAFLSHVGYSHIKTLL